MMTTVKIRHAHHRNTTVGTSQGDAHFDKDGIADVSPALAAHLTTKVVGYALVSKADIDLALFEVVLNSAMTDKEISEKMVALKVARASRDLALAAPPANRAGAPGAAETPVPASLPPRGEIVAPEPVAEVSDDSEQPMMDEITGKPLVQTPRKVVQTVALAVVSKKRQAELDAEKGGKSKRK